MRIVKSANILKNLSVATAGAALISVGVAGTAQATVLTFDDVTSLSSAAVDNGYGGLNWNNIHVINTSTYLPSGYVNGVVSKDYVALNTFEEVGTVGGTAFDFNGTYLTAAWNNGLSILVEGLKNGVSLYSKTVIVDTKAPTWFNFDFLGVDQLNFKSFGGTNAGYVGEDYVGEGTHFVMDNFTFNETKTKVPEPTSVFGLLAFGALGAGSLKRKQQQKATIKA